MKKYFLISTLPYGLTVDKHSSFEDAQADMYDSIMAVTNVKAVQNGEIDASQLDMTGLNMDIKSDHAHVDLMPEWCNWRIVEQTEGSKRYALCHEVNLVDIECELFSSIDDARAAMAAAEESTRQRLPDANWKYRRANDTVSMTNPGGDDAERHTWWVVNLGSSRRQWPCAQTPWSK